LVLLLHDSYNQHKRWLFFIDILRDNVSIECQSKVHLESKYHLKQVGNVMREIIHLTIKRAVIEGKCTAGVEQYFHQLTKEGLSAFQSVVFHFEGYDDASDQIYEINEIRDWVHSLFLLFPHFMYFINHEMDSHILLLACLNDLETVQIGESPHLLDEYEEYRIVKLVNEPRFYLKINMDEDILRAMDYALQNYGKSIGDFTGAALTVEGIRNITNKWIS